MLLGARMRLSIWDKIFAYFQKQTCAKARQLQMELRAVSLDCCTVKDYLLRIRKISDALASIGDLVPLN